jgi:cell division topological specificity factor MinE
VTKKPSPAEIAKDRLRTILETERPVRPEREEPRFLPLLSRELRDIVERHVHVRGDEVQITIDEVDGQAVLQLFVRLPDYALDEPQEEEQQEARLFRDRTGHEQDPL